VKEVPHYCVTLLHTVLYVVDIVVPYKLDLTIPVFIGLFDTYISSIFLVYQSR